MALVFPGMDPYLEAPGIWPGFHDALLFCIRECLQPILPDRYYAEIQTREELGIGGLETARVFYPDVGVKERRPLDDPRTAEHRDATGRSLGEAPMPEHLVIAEEDSIHVSYLEIRETANDGRLVTIVEVLSPSNKHPGPDRDAFERKQKDILESRTHWIEIDLLRSGMRLGGHPSVDAHCRRRGYDYVVVVSRSDKRLPRLDLELLGFGVRDPLPRIPVPLLEGDPDVVLDLGTAFRRAYETGPYPKILRYGGPALPPLDEEDARWAAELLSRPGAVG